MRSISISIQSNSLFKYQSNQSVIASNTKFEVQLLAAHLFILNCCIRAAAVWAPSQLSHLVVMSLCGWRFFVANITNTDLGGPTTLWNWTPILRTVITNGLAAWTAVMASSVANIWTDHFTGIVEHVTGCIAWCLFLCVWYELFGGAKWFCAHTTEVCLTILIWHPVWRPCRILNQVWNLKRRRGTWIEEKIMKWHQSFSPFGYSSTKATEDRVL